MSPQQPHSLLRYLESTQVECALLCPPALFFLKWLHWRAKSFTSLIFSAGHFTRSDGKAGSSPEHLRYPICFATFDLQNKTNSCHTPFTLSPNLKARDYWFYLQGHWELWSCKLIWVWLTVSTKKTVRWEISCFFANGTLGIVACIGRGTKGGISRFRVKGGQNPPPPMTLNNVPLMQSTVTHIIWSWGWACPYWGSEEEEEERLSTTI